MNNKYNKRVTFLALAYCLIIGLAVTACELSNSEPTEATSTTIVETTVVETTTEVFEPTTTEKETVIATTTEKPTVLATTAIATTKAATTTSKQEYSTDYSEDELELLAHVTIAEAEGESEYGKRLVIDTILNRVDSSRYPNTISGVIYQSGQFSCTTDGRMGRCSATDEARRLVKEELESRTNSEVIFFRTGRYSSYGTPLFKEGNHYFSGH